MFTKYVIILERIVSFIFVSRFIRVGFRMLNGNSIAFVLKFRNGDGNHSKVNQNCRRSKFDKFDGSFENLLTINGHKRDAPNLEMVETRWNFKKNPTNSFRNNPEWLKLRFYKFRIKLFSKRFTFILSGGESVGRTKISIFLL